MMTGRETTRLTPFWDWLEWYANWNSGGQRNFFSIGTIRPVLVIYDTSRAGMHLQGTRKTCGVAEPQSIADSPAGRVRTSPPNLRNCRSF
jgi:hypothetical protein